MYVHLGLPSFGIGSFLSFNLGFGLFILLLLFFLSVFFFFLEYIDLNVILEYWTPCRKSSKQGTADRASLIINPLTLLESMRWLSTRPVSFIFSSSSSL